MDITHPRISYNQKGTPPRRCSFPKSTSPILIMRKHLMSPNWRQEDMGMTEDEMASPTRWTWVWASSRSWWWTGKPGMLQSMRLQRVGQNWVTELNWFCLAQHPPDSSTLWHESEFLFFLKMNNVMFHVYTTFFWSIHLITDTWVASTFWLLWIMLLRTWT